jgi:hypothetical protein
MTYWETIDEREHNGFLIVTSITHEDTHPRDQFEETPEDMAEMCRKIDNGLLSWFVVRVQAFKHGVLLGTDYLGGNLYENPSDFVKEGGYYSDMVHTVTTEAANTIELLAA